MAIKRSLVGAVAALAASSVAGKTALLVIDVQDCFLEKDTTSGNPGSLSVPASHIIPKINSIRQQKSCLFDKVVFSQDYHPVNHISFGSSHGLAPFAHLGGKGSLPLKCVKPSSGNTADGSCCPTFHIDATAIDCSQKLCPPTGWDYTVNNSALVASNPACTTCKTNPSSCFDMEQAMWTDHCLQSGDSTFPPSLDKQSGDVTVRKGKNQFVDAYSAFMDNTQAMKTELDDTLQAEGITELYVVGIATDVCVAATVSDAFNSKTGSYTVNVITDAMVAVLGSQANHQSAINDMSAKGAKLMTTAEVLALSCPTTTTAAQMADGARSLTAVWSAAALAAVSLSWVGL
mmetsp:Transcript_27874/g.63027  ORF Transcript_27874/g.63027 Transcript_27874/m.63027 type:complete len:346 (-) Transcript_27874:112-1149(-)